MKNVKLFTSVAVAALIAGAPAAFATDVGNIVQSATQTDNVDNSGLVTVIKLQGDASSASVSATGALSAVAVTGINSGPDDVSGDADIANKGGSTFISQTSTLTGGDVTNDGIIDIDNSGGVFGDGASASISATGAASAVNAVYINATGNANFGNVTQVTTVNGGADVTNNGIGAIDTDGSGTADQLFDPFDVTGDGASVSVSATGAVSSVGLTGINSNANAKQSVGNVNQTATTANGSDVSNRGTGPTTNVDSLRGDGSSASISATGSASSVSITQIGAVGTAPNFQVGNITQNTSTGNGDVTNTGIGLSSQAALADDIELTGTGASASISATGAVSAVSATFIESIGGSKTVIGNVNQTTSKGPGAVTNTGRAGSSDDFILSGDATSVSISATGAASAVSATFVNSGELDLVSTGNITQSTTNNSTVTNDHRGPFGGTPNTDNGAGPDATINVGNISGDAASVSVSATGAVSSVSLTSVNNSGVGVTPNVSVGNVNQTSTNTGDVINQATFHNGKTADADDSNNAPDTVINVGNISGTASSASVSATGAIAALSVSTVNGTQGLGNTTVGNINQTATNSGSVSNHTATAGSTAAINAGSLTGSGTSATVSATGAAASASFSAID